MIYTTYFANVKNLPSNIVPVAISGSVPEGWKGFRCKRLAPKWSFFKQWKETKDNEYYIREYNKQVLSSLDPHELMENLSRYFGNDIALVCYEKPSDFCHRHLVAEWLREASYKVEEWSENHG